MRVFSAADAVSPRFNAPETCSSGRSSGALSEARLVAILTEGLEATSTPAAVQQALHPYSGSSWPFHFEPYMIAIAVAAVLLAMILGLLISYLITRLRFAFFHCSFTTQERFGPAGRSIASRQPLFLAQRRRWTRLSRSRYGIALRSSRVCEACS